MTPREWEHARAEAIEDAKRRVLAERAIALSTDYVVELLDKVIADHRWPRPRRATRRPTTS